MVVLSVHKDSVCDRAGLEQGDRVLAVNGEAIHNVRDWEAIRANAEFARPEHWEIARADKPVQLTLNFPQPSWSEQLRLLPPGPGALGYLVFIAVSLALGLVIAFRRPNDPVARIGAWALATAALSFGLPSGWAATWRHLPAMLGLLLWIPEIGRFVSDAILFTFFTIFPRRLFRARWPWLLLWTPGLVLLPWRTFGAYQIIYQPGGATHVPAWVFSAVSLRSAVYVMGGVLALVVGYKRLEDVNQRRRVRVLLAGLVVSTLGVVVWLASGAGRAQALWLLTLQTLSYLALLAFPLSFAYAILRHRLFDIRVMMRQGLQYTLARRVLLWLVPALVGILLADLLLHGDQPLVEILRARGWVYLAFGGLAFVGHARRRQWLEALDRHFFREHYDAQRLLREVVEEVREVGSFERVAPHVVARIEAALHPEFVALSIREPREASYHSLASAPAGQAPPPVPAESKLMALLRVLGKPVEVSLSESGWLKQQLPREETDFLRQARIDLLVPISIAPDRTEALLTLGVKRSEEPYTGEDKNLLVAIAASLALLLEKPAAAPARVSEAFEECPQCGACYDTGAGRCAQEGASLSPMHLPRLLAGRYRLERRRGRGGMGTVYEARDTALERRVAVKVIRDELVGSADAAERFRREARAAASFTHPNVVTVYDFGVGADTRAFLVMELLEGATVREELQKSKRLTPARVVEILRGACAAVEGAHRRQLIHRDLKPENIFLARTDTGEVTKVLDFGIAKFLPAASEQTRDTASGLLVGTVNYMSPEQLQGRSAQATWDLWALAVVTYEMLTGAHPFARVTAAECHAAVLTGCFSPVATHLPDAPTRWQEFFARAFSLNLPTRPASAQMFFAELERALS